MSRISREQMLMEIAHVAAKRGTCGRLAVGTVIARESRVISIGYAGVPSGAPHCEQFGCDLTKPCFRTNHAEHNAITFALEHKISIEECDMYVTDSPCYQCACKIVAARITRVFYDRAYRDDSGVRHLIDSGIGVYQLLQNGFMHHVE